MDRFKGEFGKIEGGIFEGGLIPIVSYIQNTATFFLFLVVLHHLLYQQIYHFFSFYLLRLPYIIIMFT